MDLEKISSENLNKEIAYLFGVYLTDGSISIHKDGAKSFSLKAIDEDFVKKTLECIKKIKPDCRANIYNQEPRVRYWDNGNISKCQKQYCIHVGFGSLAETFLNQTGNKHHIPICMWNAKNDIKKWFIAGAMDGDGHISKTKRDYGENVYQYRIGIGGVEEGWIYEFKELLEQTGVKTQKAERTIKNRRKPMVSFKITVKSFIENGLFFCIKRKQDRVKILRNVQRLNVTSPTGLR